MKTITNIIISHAVFLAFFGFAALVLAEDTVEISAETEATIENTDSLTPGERQAALKDQAEARKTEMQENATERKDQLDAKREEMQENQTERKEQFEEKRAEIQENIAERRIKLQERAQERITNLAANMSNRMDAVIERIQNIINRLDSRIEKLSDRGVDTAAAEAALASAQISIDAAVAEIATIDIEVTAAVSSEDARTAWSGVKESYTTIRDHLKTAHTELRASVEALKIAVAAEGTGPGASDAVRAENTSNLEEEEPSN